jgi:hypothetical protein
MRIRILVRLCRRKKLDFEIKNVLYVGNAWYVIKHTNVGTKAILKGWKSGSLLTLVNFLAPGS